jgi:hypothetical protein
MGQHFRRPLPEGTRLLYKTCLGLARNRTLPVGVFLIAWGSDDEQLRLGGDYGSALCAACANGHKGVVDILLREGNITKNTG